jgi:hypothetical protein
MTRNKAYFFYENMLWKAILQLKNFIFISNKIYEQVNRKFHICNPFLESFDMFSFFFFLNVMSCEVLKELYKTSYLYEYVPLRIPITREYCDTLLENYKSSLLGYCMDWISKTLLRGLRVRTILILLCLFQLFSLVINLHILLIILGWVNATNSMHFTRLTFETIDLFFTVTFSPLSTISVDGKITLLDSFWFLLRFSFSFLVLCHLLSLLRCFSVSCATRTWYLVIMQLFFCLFIHFTRLYTIKSLDDSTFPFNSLFLFIPISSLMFYLLIFLYTQHFIKQEYYTLACLALEWPYYYGFKYYVFHNYLNSSFYVFGSSLEKMPLNPISVTLPSSIDQP